MPVWCPAIPVLQDFENEQYQDLAQRLAPQYLVLDKEKDDAFPLYFEDMMTGSQGNLAGTFLTISVFRTLGWRLLLPPVV